MERIKNISRRKQKIALVRNAAFHRCEGVKRLRQSALPMGRQAVRRFLVSLGTTLCIGLPAYRQGRLFRSISSLVKTSRGAFRPSAKMVFILFIAVFMLAGVFEKEIVYAGNIKYKILLENEKTAPGRQVELFFLFPHIIDAPPPEIPFVDGLDIKYKGISKHPLKGVALTHQYSVVPLKKGKFQIGPVNFEYDKDVYISNFVFLEVTADKEYLPERKEQAVTKVKNIRERIYLKTELSKRTFYVNEGISVIVKFCTDWLDVENLRLIDAPSNHFIAGEYKPNGSTVIEKNGDKIIELEYIHQLFALQAGLFEFGPVTAVCNIARRKGDVLNNNEEFYNKFLGREERQLLEVNSEVFKLEVQPLPPENRPKGFKGAVGDFVLDVDFEQEKLGTEKNAVLIMKISGKGNYDSISIPMIMNIDGIELLDAETVRKDDCVTFKQRIKPKSLEGTRTLEVIFDFFSPTSKSYVSVRKPMDGINISSIAGDGIRTEKVSPCAIIKAQGRNNEKKEKDMDDIIALKTCLEEKYVIKPFFYKQGVVRFLLIMPLILFAVTIVAQKRRKKLRDDRIYAGWYKASKGFKKDIIVTENFFKKGDVKQFYQQVCKTMQNYLGRRFFLEAGSISEEIADNIILPRLGRLDVSKKIKNIFSDCYFVKYTYLEFTREDMETTINQLKEIIHWLNAKKVL